MFDINGKDIVVIKKKKEKNMFERIKALFNETTK